MPPFTAAAVTARRVKGNKKTRRNADGSFFR